MSAERRGRLIVGKEDPMSKNADTVRSIYAAFARGDVPAILEHIREDVVWEHDTHERGIPWIMPGRGREQVGRFFATIASLLEPRGFEVLNVLEGGGQVAAVTRVHWVVKATRKEFRDLEVHLWTFDAAGRVERFKHVIDSLEHWRAAQPD
jgi:ketosteroid isomerase-like protein